MPQQRTRLVTLMFTAALVAAGCGGGGDGGGGSGGGGGAGGGGEDAGGQGGGSGGVGGACDIYKNTGCTGGQVCAISASNSAICEGSAGKLGERGDTCMDRGASDDCKGGLFCATVDATGKTGLRCHEPCLTHADCSTKILKCQLRVYHAGQMWMACSDRCSVWSQNTCQSGEQCTWSKEDGAVCVATPGTNAIGSPCTKPGDCVQGAMCFEGTCRQTCKMAGGAAMCGEGTKCTTGSCKQPTDSGLGEKAEDPCLGVCM